LEVGRNYNVGTYFNWYAMVVSDNVSNKHHCHFFRADARDVPTEQASRHQKMGVLGNNCCYVGFSYADIDWHDYDLS